MVRARRAISQHLHIDYSLDELFLTEEDLVDKMAQARMRIILAFHHATENHRGRKKGTDNYIVGLSGRRSELAVYVMGRIRHPFIKAPDLDHLQIPKRSKQLEVMLRKATYDIIMLEHLDSMCHQPAGTPDQFRTGGCEIWYDEVRGYWQIYQSSVDECTEYRRSARAQFKHDDRTYHGRVRSQSARRGVSEGVSIGNG